MRMPAFDESDDVLDPRLYEPLRVTTDCQEVQVQQANQIAKAAFAEDALPLSTIEAWRARNPRVLSCLLAGDGVVVGYVDILPLAPDIHAGFYSGEKEERDLDADAILPAKKMSEASVIYLAGMVVPAAGLSRSVALRRRLTLMLAAAEYVEKQYAVPPARKVWALGSLPPGIRILHGLGFGVIRGARERKDGMDLYGLELDSAALAKLRARFRPLRRRFPFRWR